MKTYKGTQSSIALISLCLLLCGCGSETRSFTENRVEKTAAREFKGGDQVAELYCYSDPADPEHFGNVFRMGNGDIISIMLMAKNRRGLYAGDAIAIVNLDNCNFIKYETSETPSRERSVSGHLVTFEREHGDIIIKVDGVYASYRSLCRWRAQDLTETTTKIGGEKFKLRKQGSTVGDFMFFSEKASLAWIDPNAKEAEMAPTYVVPVQRRLANGEREYLDQSPIGDSGYILQRGRLGDYDVVLAK